jgi:hypothetical protein
VETRHLTQVISTSAGTYLFFRRAIDSLTRCLSAVVSSLAVIPQRCRVEFVPGFLTFINGVGFARA